MGSHPKESLASLDAIEARQRHIERRRQSSQASGIATQETGGRPCSRLSFGASPFGAIARELGIHRNTVRKYAEAKSPPMMRTRGRSRVSQSDGMTAA